MSDERPTPAAAARMPADLTGRDPARTLAGLIDVLDRADGGTPRRRPLPAARRRRAGRRLPLRRRPHRSPALGPARPAGPAGPGPLPRAAAGAGAVRRRRPDAAGLLARLTRRVALWGAGPGGAYLAWHRPRRRDVGRGPSPGRRAPSGARHARASWPRCGAGPPSGAPACTASTWPGPPRRCPARRPDLPARRRRSRRAARAAQHPHSPARDAFPRRGARSRPGVFPRRPGSTSRPRSGTVRRLRRWPRVSQPAPAFRCSQHGRLSPPAGHNGPCGPPAGRRGPSRRRRDWPGRGATRRPAGPGDLPGHHPAARRERPAEHSATTAPSRWTPSSAPPRARRDRSPLLPQVTATATRLPEHHRTLHAHSWLPSDGAPPAADRLLRSTHLASTHRRLLLRSARTLQGGRDRRGAVGPVRPDPSRGTTGLLRCPEGRRPSSPDL